MKSGRKRKGDADAPPKERGGYRQREQKRTADVVHSKLAQYMVIGFVVGP